MGAATLCAAVIAAFAPMPAAAKEGDTFGAFLSTAYYYDNNLFRLAENENPNLPQRDDRYGVLSAGLNVDWKPGRQEIVASAVKNLVRYDQYQYLDYDGEDLQATWNWRLGNHLSGNLGATSSITQSSFADVAFVNNQVDRERRFGRAEWEFHPRWRIGGGVEEIDNNNSALTQISQDFHQHAQDVVLSYLTPKGSDLRAQVRRLDAEFPNPQILQFASIFGFVFPTQVADNSYTQTEYNLMGDWRVSSKLALRGRVGWVDRQYENVLRGDFNFIVPQLKERPDFGGFTARVSADWYTTGKTLLSMAAYREPGLAQDINASSVMKTGASVNGVWLVREKWRLNAGATFENRDFKGDPGTTQMQRNDDTLGASLSVSYMPTETVSVDLGANAGRRDSNLSNEDYKFHMLYANVRAEF